MTHATIVIPNATVGHHDAGRWPHRSTLVLVVGDYPLGTATPGCMTCGAGDARPTHAEWCWSR